MTLNLPTEYVLESIRTSRQFPDKGWTLDAPGENVPSLIRAVYKKKQLDVKDTSYGVFRFADWLPVLRFLEGSSAPVTYKSEGLASFLGLKNLYITFSGYWPEKGALMRTCSFKETEAYAVCGRLPDNNTDVLVVASAGNTARAFARVCSDNQVPLLLCVPHDNLDALWFDSEISNCVRLVTTISGSDYYDAIHLSNLVCGIEGFFAEGGAKNVARRDGMGTTVLSAAHEIGHIPDFYFQAIGSGTGAIAAWEANLRLINDGNYGHHKMKLMVSQNIPFLPVYDAWKAGSRDMLPLDDDLARRQVEEISAKVLSNRKPPYGITGGLYDALKDSDGQVLTATNMEAQEAAIVFESLEGNDIHPAAAIATATLIKEAQAGRIPADACVMLNITGGGEKRFKQEKQLYYLQPSCVFDINPDPDDIIRAVCSLFS
jgi:cysteate synthase